MMTKGFFADFILVIASAIRSISGKVNGAGGQGLVGIIFVDKVV